MYGKDLIGGLSTKIIRLIEKESIRFSARLFDEKGEKIWNQGKWYTIEQWLDYASPESLSLYMCQNPKERKNFIMK